MSTSGSGWRIHGDDTHHHQHHNAPPGVGATRLLLEQVSACDEVELTAAGEGCGGVYFVTCRGKTVGVFKPEDEEVGAENNPKGHMDAHAQRRAGAPREVAAYLMDQRYGGRSGVPATVRVAATRGTTGERKWGSLQAHVAHDDSAENYGASMMPVLDVHKIGVLDVRLVNNDRHFANILVSRKKGGAMALTPIDHGETLSSCLDLGRARFEWMQWKQSKVPFSKETLAHIASLDPDRDAQCLRKLGIDEECVASMVLATKLLQLGAAHGMSLWDIGNFIQRDLSTEDEPSALEKALLRIAKTPQPSQSNSAWAKEVMLQASRIVREVVLPGSDAAAALGTQTGESLLARSLVRQEEIIEERPQGSDQSATPSFSSLMQALVLIIRDHECIVPRPQSGAYARTSDQQLQGARQLLQLQSVLVVRIAVNN